MSASFTDSSSSDSSSSSSSSSGPPPFCVPSDLDIEGLITGQDYCAIDEVLCHENVVPDRLEGFTSYLRTLSPYVILPSIVVCNKTMTLIDGHHRIHALRNLGYEKCPITLVDYSDTRIVTDIEPEPITKQAILDAALNNQLLPPKSSFHHIIDRSGKPRPIILISRLSDMQ